MHRTIIRLALAALLAAGASAHAGVLRFAPTDAVVAVGGTVAVDLVLAELAETVDVAYFTVDVAYDPTVVAVEETILGTGLGDVALGDALDISFPSAPGLLNVAVESFLPDLAAQASEFVLATLRFRGLAEGDAALGFGLAEFEGPSFVLLDVAMESGSLRAVAEPPVAFLAVMALIAALLRARRRTAEAGA